MGWEARVYLFDEMAEHHEQHGTNDTSDCCSFCTILVLRKRPDDTLATASQALDNQDGMIRSYTATGGNFEQGGNIVDLTMQVTRSGHSYEVHLKLELVSGNWKILSADGV